MRTIREAVGVFESTETLDAAVEALQSYAEATKGFDPRAGLTGGAR